MDDISLSLSLSLSLNDTNVNQYNVEAIDSKMQGKVFRLFSVDSRSSFKGRIVRSFVMLYASGPTFSSVDITRIRIMGRRTSNRCEALLSGYVGEREERGRKRERKRHALKSIRSFSELSYGLIAQPSTIISHDRRTKKRIFFGDTFAE